MDDYPPEVGTYRPDFPSMLPFWIKVQGFPIHLWKEQTICSIGEDIGTYEKAEITSTSVQMRVHVNGRLPLIKHSIIEYSNCDEVEATLVYERLEKHCSKCNWLDHDLKDCLEEKAQKKALLAAQEAAQKSSNALAQNPPLSHSERRYESEYLRKQTHRREDMLRYSQDQSLNRSNSHRPSRDGSLACSRPRDSCQGGRMSYRHEWQPKGVLLRDDRNPFHKEHNYHNKKNASKKLDQFRGDSHSISPSKSRELRAHGLGEEEHGSLKAHRNSPQEINSASRSRIQPSTRGDPLRPAEPELPPEAVKAAMGEIIGAMTLYANCADPSESSARKEWLRLAEAQGQVEESAPQMVRASIARELADEVVTEPLGVGPQDRLPVAVRLGPVNIEPGSNERPSIMERLGPVNVMLPETDAEENHGYGGSLERIPVAERLGPVMNEDEEEALVTRAPTEINKRKPGTPPGRRKVPASPAPMQASSSRKRKLQQTKPPTGRKKPPSVQERPRKVTKAGNPRGATLRPSMQSSTPSSSVMFL